MITARITLYSNKKYPVKSGYRPLFLICGNYYSGVITFEGEDINQNETRSINIDFPNFQNQLKKGSLLKVFESPNNEIGEILIL